MKQYVLDTNILIESPDAIFGFDDNLVCITMKTLEELDGLKNLPETPDSMPEKQSATLIL